jgi:polynucleotide 5'-hydroxyl-kinase GRC3/NOL9
VLLVGGPDTGKTTLARFLYQRWQAQGMRVALLDCDIGQSSIGLPTTMTLRMPSEDTHRDCAYFIGSVTPRRFMLPMLVGVRRLHQKALELGAEAIIVDTTGLVDPAQGGVALKEAKIELLMPCRVVALARGAELNPILRSWEGHPAVRTTRLPVPLQARARSRSERVKWRQERWNAYFERATPVTFPFASFAMMNWLLPTAQRTCAFLDAEGFCLGLGRIVYLDRKAQAMTVETPLHSLEGISALRFGSPRLEAAVLGSAFKP